MRASQKIDLIENAMTKGNFTKEMVTDYLYILKSDRYQIVPGCTAVIYISASDRENGINIAIMFASIDRAIDEEPTYQIIKSLNSICKVGRFEINQNKQVGLVDTFNDGIIFDPHAVVDHFRKMVNAIIFQLDKFQDYTWIYNF